MHKDCIKLHVRVGATCCVYICKCGLPTWGSKDQKCIPHKYFLILKYKSMFLKKRDDVLRMNLFVRNLRVKTNKNLSLSFNGVKYSLFISVRLIFVRTLLAKIELTLTSQRAKDKPVPVSL